MANIDQLRELYRKYELEQSDIYKHKHYTIITRTGIDKIMAKEQIHIGYEVIECTPEFAAVRAVGSKDSLRIETFGSAKHGGKFKDEVSGKWKSHGNTDSWYVLEVAEKRAKSRVILMITGFYELGAFAEDESEEFMKVGTFEEDSKQDVEKKRVRDNIKQHIERSKSLAQLNQCWNSIPDEDDELRDLFNEKVIALS